jgi:hypothetical protein
MNLTQIAINPCDSVVLWTWRRMIEMTALEWSE